MLILNLPRVPSNYTIAPNQIQSWYPVKLGEGELIPVAHEIIKERGAGQCRLLLLLRSLL